MGRTIETHTANTLQEGRAEPGGQPVLQPLELRPILDTPLPSA